MKTQCPHCKTKFRAPEEHKGKKVKCPKCDQPFVITSFVESAQAEVCTSCGRTIGKLEQAYVLDGQIACQECDLLQRAGKESIKKTKEVIEASTEQGSLKRIVSQKHIASINSSWFIDGSLRVSPDGKRFAHLARQGKQELVVLDRQPENLYDRISEGTLVFGPDSNKLAYAARKGNKWFVVVDRQTENQYDGVRTGPIFSPDGKRVAYAAREGNKWFAVIDGQKGKQYDDIKTGPVFGPDSKRVAYAARESDKWFAVIDGQKGKQYDDIRPGPVFSPDNKRVAYGAREGKKWFTVVDGEAWNHYDGIGKDVIFSPDSKRVAYVAQLRERWFTRKSFVVIDDEPDKCKYNSIGEGTLIFSPDNKRAAYAGTYSSKWVVVVDGQVVEKSYDGIAAAGLSFSPDSRRVAYGALKWPGGSFYGVKVRFRISREWYCVVDGKEGTQYNGLIASITFSPDSKRVAYGARRLGPLFRTNYFVVVDRDEGKPYDAIIADSKVEGKIIFDSPDTFHYLAGKGDDIYLVEERIE